MSTELPALKFGPKGVACVVRQGCLLDSFLRFWGSEWLTGIPKVTG